MEYASFITTVFTTLTLATHVALALFFVGLVLKVPIVLSIRRFLGTHMTALVFLVSFSAFLGSLLYSEVVGFDPCVLCWIQRIFAFPVVILAGIALVKKDRGVGKYILGLTIPGALVAAYHSFTNLGGFSFTTCTAEGGECAKLLVLEYGYITIPMMALTTFFLMAMIVFCQRYVAER